MRRTLVCIAIIWLTGACSHDDAQAGTVTGAAGGSAVAGAAPANSSPAGQRAAAAAGAAATAPLPGVTPPTAPPVQRTMPTLPTLPGTPPAMPAATPPAAMMPPPVAAPTPAGVVFPGTAWLTKAPADAGFDAAKLETAANDLLTSFPGRQCMAVFKDGYLVYEKYYTGDEHTLNAGFSTSKSFGSTLVGMAVTQGLFNTDDLVSSLVPDTTVLPDIKIKHLLTMTGHVDPPGTMFDYSMGQMLLGNLANAIANKSGMTTGQFYEKNLKSPLQFQDIDWGGGRFLSFAGNVSTTCRDGARLGHLWANHGVWNGQRLISEAYFSEATSAPFPMANSGYGYNFWLNLAYSRTKPVGLSFGAIGANGQYIIIIPSMQLVITSYGNDPDGQMSGGPGLAGGVLNALL